MAKVGEIAYLAVPKKIIKEPIKVVNDYPVKVSLPPAKQQNVSKMY